MVKSSEVLALIPARGGSKGIPHKNIRDFAGYPLLAYSIAAGLQAESVSRVIISTDDPAIAQIAEDFGAEVPFLRPGQLAQDDTLDLPVFEHALSWLKANEGYFPEMVVQLRPTSPIRPIGLVDRAVEQLRTNPQADSVRGVVPAGQNPYKMWWIENTEGRMTPLLTLQGVHEPYNAPRQQLPQAYWQTGHIDVIRRKVIVEQHSMSGGVILPAMIDPNFSVDIDTLRDWSRAEWLVREGVLEMIHPCHRPRPWPQNVRLVVFDFDGVMTDDRVWVNQDGLESVSANRSDGMGIEMLLAAGFRSVIISTEANPVVAARAKKMRLPYFHGVGDKARTLSAYLEQEQILAQECIYVGNDVNDLACFPLVGCAFAVANAHPDVLRQADRVLRHRGGRGAVREVCDLLIRRYGKA